MLKPIWDEYDTTEVMKYASFTLEDIEEVYGSQAGDNDGPSWIAYGKLKNGKYFYVTAGCDYTGWGWQEDGSSSLADTKEDIEKFHLTEDDRQRLGIVLWQNNVAVLGFWEC